MTLSFLSVCPNEINVVKGSCNLVTGIALDSITSWKTLTSQCKCAKRTTFQKRICCEWFNYCLKDKIVWDYDNFSFNTDNSNPAPWLYNYLHNLNENNAKVFSD